MHITVMGATGRTGAKITRLLLEAGAIGRDAGKLSVLERQGAAVFAGDSRDAGFLAGVFSGSQAVYTLLATDRQAPDYAASQHREGEAIVQAKSQPGRCRAATGAASRCANFSASAT
ncbi:MAG: NAD(P)H-binding protein [Variovorax sp.]